jgi:hypothetical protein
LLDSAQPEVAKSAWQMPPAPAVVLRGDAQLLLDVRHHRVRQASLAEFREVLIDDAFP